MADFKLNLNLNEVVNACKNLKPNSAGENNIENVTGDDIASSFDKTKKDANGGTNTKLFANTFFVEQLDYSLADIENLSDEDYALFEMFGGLDGNSDYMTQEEADAFVQYWEENIQENNVKYKEDERIKKDDDGNNYVEVEKYTNGADGTNGNLYNIIENSYDLEAMGIKKHTPEFEALVTEVMNANPDIYGKDESDYDSRINSTIHVGDKIILPGVQQNTPETLSTEQIDEVLGQVTSMLESNTPAEILSVIENYSSEDVMTLLNKYEETNGTSLVDDIQEKFSGKDAEELIGEIAEDILNVALQGDEKALDAFAKELAQEKFADAKVDGIFAQELARNWSQVSPSFQMQLQSKFEGYLEELKNLQPNENDENSDDKEPVGAGNGYTVDPQQLEYSLGETVLEDMQNAIKEDPSKFVKYLQENPNLTSADIAKLVDVPGMESVLKECIQDAYSGDANKELRQQYYDKVINALLDMSTTGTEDGNKALMMLAREIDRCPGELVFNCLLNTDNVDGLNKLFEQYQKDADCGGPNDDPNFDLYDLIYSSFEGGISSDKSELYVTKLMNKVADHAVANGVGLTDDQIREFAENIYDFTWGDEMSGAQTIMSNFLFNSSLSDEDRYKVLKAVETNYASQMQANGYSFSNIYNGNKDIQKIEVDGVSIQEKINQLMEEYDGVDGSQYFV